MNSVNPFRDNRTEYMEELWKQYVPFEDMDNVNTPVVVVGGRGSGKTMYFKCNSWREQLRSFRSQNMDDSIFLNTLNGIGLYYRVDTIFVASFCDSNINNWEGLFNTYINTVLIKDILLLFIEIGYNEDQNVVEAISRSVGLLSKKAIEANDCKTLLSICESVLDELQEVINNPELDIVKSNVNNTSAGLILKKFAELVGKDSRFKEIKFKVYIDEYENFSEKQQRIINTLIKHSESSLMYNIAMRPKGMKTKCTLGSSELIELVHDYSKIRLDDIDYDDKYMKLINDIIGNRIRYLKENGSIPKEAPEEIEFYLGKYSFDEELNNIDMKKTISFSKELEMIIESQTVNKKSAEEYIRVLVNEAPIINQIIHLALLKRTGTYKQSVEDIYKNYVNESSKYKDWYHNMKNAALYLILREMKHKKKYFGYDAYLKISSGVIRYFLELCEKAFDLALLDGFNWKQPKRISIEIQTKAAKYVSKGKIADLDYYEPYGKNFKIFVKYIGDIFKAKHYDKESTLGEPEINHFSTKDLKFSEELQSIVNFAVMWNVLQECDPTKSKDAELPIESKDYLINRIYVPYFDISYRKIRKMYIAPDILEKLLSGNDDIARQASNKLIRSNNTPQSDSHQLTFFEEV